MRRIQRSLQVIVTAIVLCGCSWAGQVAGAQTETVDGPSLTISQLKITSSNGQFITLYNSTDSVLDMSKYQLEYFNHYDLSKATSSKLISLSGTVPPHGYFMVNDSVLLMCYQLTVDSMSLGLSSTAGLVEVLAFNQSLPGSPATPVLQDYVGWSKTAAAGAQTLPTGANAFLQRRPLDAKNNPAVTIPGGGNWQTVQPDSGNPCTLVSTTVTPAIVPTGLGQLLPSTEPPATILTVAAESGTGASQASLPAADIGLMAPQISELLANPVGTGNDDTDEFIELYNANTTAFDLSGFSLQVGTTSLHTYVFPAGSSLPARSFHAFHSAVTGLSLSNSGGQAKLLDPFGNSISAAEPYGTAKDGQAWALAKGKWYWTTKITPGAENVIEIPASSKKAGAKTKAAGKTSSAAKTATVKSVKSGSAGAASSQAADTASTTPIHPGVLALVAGLALLYGAYEYRTDLANRIHRLRSHFRVGRSNRP